VRYALRGDTSDFGGKWEFIESHPDDLNMSKETDALYTCYTQ